jgi:hypothetical protein
VGFLDILAVDERAVSGIEITKLLERNFQKRGSG